MDRHHEDGRFVVPQDLDPPFLAGLHVVFNVKHRATHLFPRGLIVAEDRSGLVHIRPEAVDVKEISSHSGYNAWPKGGFLRGFLLLAALLSI
jgi:hypothetical protein